MKLLHNYLLVIACVSNLCYAQIASADVYSMPKSGNDVVGHTYTVNVKDHDSITTIRQRNDVSYEELVAANPNVNFYKLRVGQTIVIPKELILPKIRQGIVINIPELRLYYFTPDGQDVYTFPVGLGRVNWRTPIIDARVTAKEIDPTWDIPNSIRNYVRATKGIELPDSMPPGPDNPLGKYALHLSKPGYLIHGTNQQDTVGIFISSGCIRVGKDAIKTLYEIVPIGAPVHIIHNPAKAGWLGSTLYIESHKSVRDYAAKQASELNESGMTSSNDAVRTATANRPAYVNWDAVAQATRSGNGVLQIIGKALD